MFSVIITTCNREIDILKKAIDSVINQTYKNIELIIVNDDPNSKYKDEIENLINSYEYKIIYILNEKQMGANYSRNIGIEHSHGEYISILDDDDFWDTTRVEKVIKEFEKKADIVYSDFYIFSKRKEYISKRKYPIKEEYLKNILEFNFLGGFSNVSFTRKLFYDVGKLNTKIPSYQDQDLFVRLIEKGVNISYIAEPLSYYRISTNSISLNYNKKLEGLKKFLEKYNELFEMYPMSRTKRLESELVYSEKQGWKDNSKEISNLLKKYVNKKRILFLKLKGKIKFFLVHYLKLQ